ncbi:MAG: hypothetical protein QNJ62_07560 [Methyloceanibacter sp.]|nr:hypothetical protein [Methyloceanibacter sp.]
MTAGFGPGSTTLSFVMPGLDPGIHEKQRFLPDVDGRVEPGHDEAEDQRTPLCLRYRLAAA